MTQPTILNTTCDSAWIALVIGALDSPTEGVVEVQAADEEPELLPTCKKMRFDLCPACFRKFVNDPLGRESTAKFDFSPN